jgi:Zn-dependent M28 family amino/carboxypeptidase
MAGRATPSPGLDHASDYVIGECVHAGLEGAADGGEFKQPFMVSGRPANNIVARMKGTGDHKDEVVLLSAHLDHLGQGYPGADDNGSGSVALIAMAHRLAASRTTRPLDRTVVFLWTVGEERGLLGSAWFTDHPPAALDASRIVQVINLDAIGALDDTRFSILPDTADHTRRTVALMTDASHEIDPPFARINQDLQEYTRRTDGYSFVRHNIPTIWVSEGLTNPLGGGTLMPRYHRPTDTVENLIAENGGNKLRRMTTMLTSTVEKVANAAF